MTQILCASFTNPNGHVTPDYEQNPALYYNDPDCTVLWGWSVQERAWVEFPVVVQTIFQGTGTPSLIPNNPNLPAVYVDLTTKVIYAWNVSTQAWI